MTSGDCGKDQAGNPTIISKTTQPTPKRKGFCLWAVKPSVASCILSGLGGRSEGGNGKDRETQETWGRTKSYWYQKWTPWSALCCGPEKSNGGMTLVSFFLSDWNSATSWDGGVAGVDEKRGEGGGGQQGFRVCHWRASQWLEPQAGGEAVLSRGLRVWSWGWWFYTRTKG